MTLQELNNIIGAVATVLGIVGTLARAIPAETWTRWERDLPRVANSLRFARAVGPDVLKALRAAWSVVRGSPWGARVAPAVDAVDAALPRETVAPSAPSDPQRGAVRVGALLAICGAVVVASVVGAVLTACDPIREGVMRVTPGVPEPSVCVPDSQRCAGAVPEVCSQSSMGNTRWWPSLSLRADGTQRVCSNGCVVDDAGVAGCASPIPGNPFADASVTEGGAL